MVDRIGDIFLKKKLIISEQLEVALQEQTNTGEFLGEILIRLGYVDEENVLKALAEQFNTKFISIKNYVISPDIIRRVPQALVWEHRFMPLEFRAGVLMIAINNPLDVWPMSAIKDKLNLADVHFILAKKSDISEAIHKYYPLKREGG
jgi:type IV pilus assembly protein PilB